MLGREGEREGRGVRIIILTIWSLDDRSND